MPRVWLMVLLGDPMRSPGEEVPWRRGQRTPRNRRKNPRRETAGPTRDTKTQNDQKRRKRPQTTRKHKKKTRSPQPGPERTPRNQGRTAHRRVVFLSVASRFGQLICTRSSVRGTKTHAWASGEGHSGGISACPEKMPN